MNVEILRHPTEEDWRRCKFLAMTTIGKSDWSGNVTDEWKHKILRSGHSPIRTLMFTIRMTDIPYWVAMHFRTHKIGVEHFISSQRNDRQSEYDRNKAFQDAPVTHVMDINAAELIYMAQTRLCIGKVAAETRQTMRDVCDAVIEYNPEFAPFFGPKCEFMAECNEFLSCGHKKG